jgi:hypothetical protein
MDILEISPEALESMFGDTPTETKLEESKPVQIQDTNILQPQGGLGGIQEFDLDKLEEAGKTTKEDKTSTDKISTEKTETSEPKEITEEGTQIKNILSNTTKYLIEKGIWQDFEGSDTLDIDEDTYAELAAKQTEEKVNSLFSELIDSTGDYGRAIISHIKEGGNPDEIIDLFKEQKYTESIDTSTPEGQVNIIGKYYNEVLGWKPERIQKHLQRIIADDDVEAESSEIEDKYKEHYQEQLAQIEGERMMHKERNLERQKEFVTGIKSSLAETEYTTKERQLIEQALLNVKKTDMGPITDFNLKFAELQKDPKKLIDLVYYVMDQDGFKKRVNTKAETKVAEKTFSFIKGNSSISKNVTSSMSTNDSKNKLDFSSLLK